MTSFAIGLFNVTVDEINDMTPITIRTQAITVIEVGLGFTI